MQGFPDHANGQEVLAVPFVRIGVDAGDRNQEFYRIADVDLIGDSAVAVANLGTMDVRIFDIRGRFIASWGRKGSGPGEFQAIYNPGGVHVARDSLWVFDWALQRVTVFSLRGSVGRTIPLSRFRKGQVALLGVFPDGSLLLRGSSSSLANVQGWQATNVELFIAFEDSALPLGNYFWKTSYMARQPTGNGEAWGDIPLPGSIQALFATSAEGFWYADGRFARLELRAKTTGRITRTQSITIKPFEASALRAAQRTWLSQQDPFWQTKIRDAVHAAEAPNAPPRGAVELIVENDGTVWYAGQDYSARAARIWYRHEKNGKTSSIRFPAGVRLLSIHKDIAAGVERDEVGVEYVVLFRVPRT